MRKPKPHELAEFVWLGRDGISAIDDLWKRPSPPPRAKEAETSPRRRSRSESFSVRDREEAADATGDDATIGDPFDAEDRIPLPHPLAGPESVLHAPPLAAWRCVARGLELRPTDLDGCGRGAFVSGSGSDEVACIPETIGRRIPDGVDLAHAPVPDPPVELVAVVAEREEEDDAERPSIPPVVAKKKAMDRLTLSCHILSDLREMCRDRQLSTVGPKAALIDRLLLAGS